MTNEKQQTAVEWFSNQAYELFEQYSEGNFDRITLNKLMFEATNKAKEMEKQKTKRSWVMGLIVNLENPFDYNFYEPLAEAYYNETYGGKNENTN